MALSDFLRLESIRKISCPSPIFITRLMHIKNTCHHLAKHGEKEKKKKKRSTLLPIPGKISKLSRTGSLTYNGTTLFNKP